MTRLFLGLSVLCCLFASAISPAGAQTPSGGAVQTVTGPTGYRYDVPADWQQLPVYLRQRSFDQMISVDGESASADGVQHAHVETASGFGASAGAVHDALMAFLQGSVGPGPSASAPSGSAPSGSTPSAAASSAPASNAGPAGPPPNLTLFATPSPVTVPNADAAESGASTYTDPNGTPRMLAARLAVRGQTSYLLVVDTTEDFYKTNPSLGAILNSFQLTGATNPSSP